MHFLWFKKLFEVAAIPVAGANFIAACLLTQTYPVRKEVQEVQSGGSINTVKFNLLKFVK